MGDAINRPFYLYGSHIELIRFKEYYGMSRRHCRAFSNDVREAILVLLNSGTAAMLVPSEQWFFQAGRYESVPNQSSGS